MLKLSILGKDVILKHRVPMHFQLRCEKLLDFLASQEDFQKN